MSERTKTLTYTTRSELKEGNDYVYAGTRWYAELTLESNRLVLGCPLGRASNEADAIRDLQFRVESENGRAYSFVRKITKPELGLCGRCAEARRPLVVSGVTNASYGAEVFVVRPGSACLDCFITAQTDGTIPEPPAGPRSTVTPGTTGVVVTPPAKTPG